MSLKVPVFLQEATDLYNNPEDVVDWRVVMNLEPFDCLVVLEHWVKSVGVKGLPISVEHKLVVRIVEHEEVLNDGNEFFQLEKLLGFK